MLAWTAVVVPLHVVLRLAGKPSLVPPTYLCGIGWIAGLRFTVEGKPRKHALLLANHLSWLDIMALAAVSRTAFVAHSGLAVSPALKWMCEQNGTLFITRDRRHTVAGQVAQVRDALGGRRLTLFPEGTTGDGRGLLPFKSALLSAVGQLPAGVPVQPVALIYTDAADIAWLAGEPGLTNAFKILGRTHGVHLTLRFLPPLAGRALADRKAIAAAARHAIARELAL
ncbi:MAG TPA: lysophospholipid acyltransferase family protein [Croceibacterium sp.]|jgi:1-acyl-sn-glycerol-3-phosphate acyltransferase